MEVRQHEKNTSDEKDRNGQFILQYRAHAEKKGERMKKIGRYMAKYWKIYIIGFLCLFGSVWIDMYSPLITRDIIDDVIVAGHLERLKLLLMGIAGVSIGRTIFQYVKEFSFDMAGQRIVEDMRRDVFKHIQKLSVNYFDKTNTGELMTRIKDDTDTVGVAVGFIGMLVIEVILHTSLVVYNMVKLNWKLAIAPLVMMPVMGVIAVVMEKKLDNIYGDISEENAKMNTVAQENLAGVRTVKAFAREKFEINKFLSRNKRYYELNMKESKVLMRFDPIFHFVPAFLPIVMVLVGGRFVINDEMSIGTLGAFIGYCSYCVWPMEMLGWLGNEFAASFASYKKLLKITKEEPLIKSPEGAESIGKVEGEITFENVSLKIDDTSILENISFKLEAGKTLGIMGATGAGKSSVINLLERFYDPTEGKILLDGHDIKTIPLADVRGNIAPVMQDVFLFSDTIGENVKFGKHDTVDAENVSESLQRAQASEFVDKLENGMETLIGERGVGLSGGQKQRISIARAFAKKAPILVFDDSTSALDMETEHKIQKDLNEMTGVTKIIIGHRISSVRNADEILFLDGGKIAERGTHEELIKKGGLYSQTYQVQYGAAFNELATV